MSSPTEARLIIDEPAAGNWNMAVDQSLLQSANEQGIVTLRFYHWAPATLSLGYFQKLGARDAHAPSLDCPTVRRASGGGAIVHDHELTYSLCLPATNRWSKKSSDLYDLMHESIRESLAEQSFEVNLYEAPVGTKIKASSDDPFLCFQRRAVGDLICDGHKIGGSAQRRLKNALIQHGSLLLAKSTFTPELPGLQDICKSNVDSEKLIESLKSKVEKRLACSFSMGTLTDEESKTATEIQANTFGSDHWLARR